MKRSRKRHCGSSDDWHPPGSKPFSSASLQRAVGQQMAGKVEQATIILGGRCVRGVMIVAVTVLGLMPKLFPYLQHQKGFPPAGNI